MINVASCQYYRLQVVNNLQQTCQFHLLPLVETTYGLQVFTSTLQQVCRQLATCELTHPDIDLSRGAPDLEFSNPAGTGFTGFGQKFRPDLPDLKQDILG